MAKSEDKSWLGLFAIGGLGFLCAACAVAALVITTFYSQSTSTGQQLQPLIQRVESLAETIETMDRRRNSQYGELRGLINEGTQQCGLQRSRLDD